MFHVKLFLLLLLPTTLFSQHVGSTLIESKELPSLPPKVDSIESYINKFSSSSALTSTEREWFYWTNYSRSNPRRFWDSVVSLIIKSFPTLKNSYSASLQKDLYNSTSLPLLKPNKNLATVSKAFAKEMAASNALPSHTSPSGLTFSNRMAVAGIKTCAGENISFGPSNPLMMLVLLYIDQGVPELGHRKTLLNPAYTEMGIGISSYPDHSVMVIQDFSCDQK